MRNASRSKKENSLCGGSIFLILSVEFDLFVFPYALNIASVTHSNIGVIATKQDLIAFRDNIAVNNTGVDGGLVAAIADSLDLLNGICDLH